MHLIVEWLLRPIERPRLESYDKWYPTYNFISIKSGCKRRQNLTFSHNQLLYIVILVSDKFWNKKICTPDFFKTIEKLLQYKKFLLYVCKDQSYSIKHENFAHKWEEKFRKLLGKIIILLLNEKFCISKYMALILWVFRKTPCFWKSQFLNLYAKL